MACNIDVEFSSKMKDMANALSAFLGISTMIDIFSGNGVIGSSYEILTTDFYLLSKSMSSSNPILVRQVENIAGRMYLKSSHIL